MPHALLRRSTVQHQPCLGRGGFSVLIELRHGACTSRRDHREVAEHQVSKTTGSAAEELIPIRVFITC